MVHQQKWYAVTVGRDPGVYSTWIEAAPKTKNIPGGSIHQSFPSEEEAIRAFEAAKARGEVKAYPDAGKKDKSTGKSKNLPLSPLGEGTSLLRLPLDSEGEAESTGLQAPLSPARVAKLRRTLRDSATESCSTSSSPPTAVTQIYAPLYQDDDPPDSLVARPSPHFTFTSGSSRAYPVFSDERFFETNAKLSLQLEVSDWDSPPSSPSSSDSHLGAEQHTSKPPSCMPLYLDPSSRDIGVKYRSLTNLADMENVDSRVWLPASRVFDPDKVKPRPLTRPPSPVKKDTSAVPRGETPDSSSPLRYQLSLVDSPFVRADRGRHSRLTPSSSLPALPDGELKDEYLGSGPCSTKLLENYRTGKREERGPDYSVRDRRLAERPTGYAPGTRNDGRSHVQLVHRDGRDEGSAIMVHCPPNCPHETCYPSPPAVPAIERSLSNGSRYVDACVSPIISMTGHRQSTDNLAKNPSERFLVGLDVGHSYEPAGFTHVPHRGIALETDVRSPISKGTMVPVNAAETPFGRPSPPVRVPSLQINRRDI